MNIALTRAADGLPRRTFTVHDIRRIAASSLTYDKGLKARLYARHGVLEFWVIDANERVTWVHTGPTGETWSSIVDRGPDEALTTPTLPQLSIRLSEIT